MTELATTVVEVLEAEQKSNSLCWTEVPPYDGGLGELLLSDLV